MGREHRVYIIYSPTLKLQCLDVRCGYIPVFFSGARIKPVSIFPGDIKCITLTSNVEDHVISRNLRNLVLCSS